MRKYVLFTFTQICMASLVVCAQNTELESGAVMSGRLFKVTNPTEDKINTVDIAAIGNVSFIVSNIADGSANSYKHSQKIVLQLIPSGTKAGNYQVIFYGGNDNIPYAVTSDDNITTIYYPMSMYESIKSKLDQFFLQKKRVQLKTVQNKNGYRETTLTF